MAVARAALRELALDRVLLMPARLAPYKLEQQDPGALHRLRMCELAARQEAGIKACGLELERPGPSYTVDTLSEIHARRPATPLTFILGADTACTLGSWREPQRLLELASLAVAERTGSPRARVLETVRALASDARMCFLRVEPVEVSSSQVRAAVAAGEPVGELVGAPVAEYIARHGLYAARDLPA